jgi:DNA polymerase
MSDEAKFRDVLNDLAKDVAEAAQYLHELGVEGIEGLGPAKKTPVHDSSTRAAVATRTAPLPQALARNAGTEPPTNYPPPPKRLTTPPSSLTSAPPIIKRTQTPDKSLATAPSSSLFGEIAKEKALLPSVGETFEDIHADMAGCVRCPLHAGRTQIVHTYGNRKARLMFVGEAPGADEDAAGRPFVGRAGQLLNKIIEAIGLKREDVLVGNVNRCRPPDNRTPTTEEGRTCKPFLLREIAIVQPSVIVVLGNTAMKNLLDSKDGITRLRGQFQNYRGIKVMPTFHPAYLLRDPSKKREVWDDMKKVRDYLNELDAASQS